MSAADVARLARALSSRERAPRAEIERLQLARLDALVAHARQHSPYYRERLPSAGAPVELRALPTLDKPTLMEHWDEIVCDTRLRRDTLLERLAGPPSVDPYLGEYRVMSTSGSSGRPGLFVYDSAGWATYVAQFLRVTGLTGMPMWEHRGLRVGIVAAADPRHVGAQVALTCAGLGLAELRPLPVTLPLERIVGGLNDYQPEVLHAYASYAALLADEQRARRLRIAPRLVTSGSELLTADMLAASKAPSASPRSTSTPPPKACGPRTVPSTRAFTSSRSSPSSRTSTATAGRCPPASRARASCSRTSSIASSRSSDTRSPTSSPSTPSPVPAAGRSHASAACTAGATTSCRCTA